MFDRGADTVLCFDIGGANLKAFHTHQGAKCVRFPLWLRPHLLNLEIASLASSLPACRTWGVTMTGEMADVFLDRADGVRAIIEQVMMAAATLAVDDVRFYATSGRFLSASQAMEASELVASANWHALACWVSTWIQRPSLLVDIGTTTVDLIPLSPGRVDTPSRSDHDRLRQGELVYLGIRRTPVCSLVDALPFAGNLVPVMRERFANSDDCALLLGWVPEDADDFDTCDSRPRTMEASLNRIARMIGLGAGQVSINQAREMAAHVMDSATTLISLAAVRHERHANSQWILSGHARRLIQTTPSAHVIDLASEFGDTVSRVGPAYALGKLIESEFIATSNRL